MFWLMYSLKIEFERELSITRVIKHDIDGKQQILVNQLHPKQIFTNLMNFPVHFRNFFTRTSRITHALLMSIVQLIDAEGNIGKYIST